VKTTENSYDTTQIVSIVSVVSTYRPEKITSEIQPRAGEPDTSSVAIQRANAAGHRGRVSERFILGFRVDFILFELQFETGR